MSSRDTLAVSTSEDRTLPIVCYALYLFGLTNGLTILIGMILAYVNRENAGPAMRTHYDFLIRTVWAGLGWLIVGCVLVGIGALFAITIIGLVVAVPIFIIAWIIFSVGLIWLLVRLVVGLIYLSRGEAHPRPSTWFF